MLSIFFMIYLLLLFLSLMGLTEKPITSQLSVPAQLLFYLFFQMLDNSLLLLH